MPHSGESTRPPPEAYSRVTDPERFRSLQAAASAALEQLLSEYRVEATSTLDFPMAIPAEDRHIPPVTLSAGPRAAPFGVAFTTFPALLVRFGRWHWDTFPSCGCDACGLDVAEEIERFRTLVRQVVGGEIAEELVVPRLRAPRLHLWLGRSGSAPDGTTGSWQVVSRGYARMLRRLGDPGRVQWEPWPRRTSGG